MSELLTGRDSDGEPSPPEALAKVVAQSLIMVTLFLAAIFAFAHRLAEIFSNPPL